MFSRKTAQIARRTNRLVRSTHGQPALILGFAGPPDLAECAVQLHTWSHLTEPLGSTREGLTNARCFTVNKVFV